MKRNVEAGEKSWIETSSDYSNSETGTLHGSKRRLLPEISERLNRRAEGQNHTVIRINVEDVFARS